MWTKPWCWLDADGLTSLVLHQLAVENEGGGRAVRFEGKARGAHRKPLAEVIL